MHRVAAMDEEARNEEATSKLLDAVEKVILFLLARRFYCLERGGKGAAFFSCIPKNLNPSLQLWLASGMNK